MAARRVTSEAHATRALQLLASHLGRDVAVPFLIYLVATKLGTSAVVGFALSAVWSALMILIRLTWARRIDWLALAVLSVILLGLGASLISGNPRFSVARESVLTGAMGLLFLGSLLTVHSPLFYACRTFVTRDEPAGIVHWDTLWRRSTSFRRVLRRLDATWGLALITEAGTRVVAAMVLPLPTAIALSPILAITTLVLLMLWTGRQGEILRAIERHESATAADAPLRRRGARTA